MKHHLVNVLCCCVFTNPDSDFLLVLVQHADEDLHLLPHLHSQDMLAVQPGVAATELHQPDVHVQHQSLLCEHNNTIVLANFSISSKDIQGLNIILLFANISFSWLGS